MEKDFTWVNDEGEKFNIAAGSNLDSEQSYEIATVNYTWSFYNSGKVELFTSAGLLPIVNAMPDNTIILRHHGKN